MKILDRYIIRTLLVTTLMWFFILMVLRIVIDMSIQMDEFVERDQTFVRTLWHILDFYGYQSLTYFNEMGGLIILLGAITTLYIMNRSNELVAMLASGVSLHRVVLPVVLCSMLLSALIVVDQELLIPRVAHKLIRDPDEGGSRKGFNVRFVTDGNGTCWYSAWYFPDKQLLSTPVCVMRDQDDLSLIAWIFGKEATPATMGRQTGWLVRDGWLTRSDRKGPPWENVPDVRRIYTNLGTQTLLENARDKTLAERRRVVSISGSVHLPKMWACDGRYGMVIQASLLAAGPEVRDRSGQPGRTRTGTLINPTFTFWSDVVPKSDGSGEFAPAGDARILAVFRAESATWKPRRPGSKGEPDDHWELTGGTLFCPSDLLPDDLVLRHSRHWVDYISISQLRALGKVAASDKAKMAIHVRATQPIVNLVMLLLGLPFILSRERNIKASALLCLLAVLTFMGFVHACRYVGLPAAWAAGLPIILFGPIAAAMIDSVKT